MAEQIEQLQLPYLEITEVANRDTLRAVTTVGRPTYWIDFSTIKIRDGFNIRKEYKEIPEFSLFIEFNGVPAPPVVDMMPDGLISYVEQGHRRYKAIELLLLKYDGDLSWLADKQYPGIRVKNGVLEVECFVNDFKIDELTRLKRQYSSNNGEKYTSLEMAELCWRMEKFFNLTQTDIGRELGLSRQHIKNYLIIAAQSDQVKQAIGGGVITATAAVSLVRKLKDSNAVNDAIQEAVASGNAITVDAVKRIQGESKSGETKGDKNQDKTITYDEGREEIRWCQNIIKNTDKIGTKVAKLDNDQLKSDIEKLIEYIHKDMELLRDWAQKNKKR
jgi:ParB-like chromosome segregation protein Spo0J